MKQMVHKYFRSPSGLYGNDIANMEYFIFLSIKTSFKTVFVLKELYIDYTTLRSLNNSQKMTSTHFEHLVRNNLHIFILSLFLTSLFVSGLKAQVDPSAILPVRERAEWIDNMLEYRIDSLLPELMRREGIQMWILISREYNEDPVMKTMLPSSWLSARRRTIMVFYDKGGEAPLEKVAIARYSVGRLLQGEWNIDVYPDQWEALVNYIVDKDPSNIGINTSDHFGLADGIAHTDYTTLMNNIPVQYRDRVVSAERLAIAWLETRSQMELDVYPILCKIGHDILKEAFSSKVISPGTTSTDDVVWWLRQRVVDLGLKTWFHPTVSIQRADSEKFDHLRSFSNRPEMQIIQPGDLLHVDFGITYLRLNTDQQQHFYVPKEGENSVPEYLQAAFKKGNRLQDILVSHFDTGISGNEILDKSLKQAANEGINASIYTHPIGFHGHAAGPTIGLWDRQEGVPGQGDYEMFYNTAYSIELNVAVYIEEWKKIIRIMLEEDGVFTKDGFYYPDGRQEKIYLVK